MKEFIEKLNNKLNERLKFYENRFEELSGTERDAEDWGSIKSYKDTIEIVKELEQEYNNGWIPCSERLPETIDDMLQCVIVTNENDWQGMAYYHPQKGWTFAECHNSDKKIDWTEIIAWQPLPQPYKPQKTEWKDKVMKHFTNVE